MQTLDEFDKRFLDEEACEEYVIAMRWPDGIVKCPRCASDKVDTLKARPFN